MLEEKQTLDNEEEPILESRTGGVETNYNTPVEYGMESKPPTKEDLRNPLEKPKQVVMSDLKKLLGRRKFWR